MSWQRAVSVNYQQRTNATKVYVVRLFIACQLAEFRKVWNAGNEHGDASRPRTKSLIVCYSSQWTAFTHSLGVRIFGTTHRESLTAQNMHVQKHRFEMKKQKQTEAAVFTEKQVFFSLPQPPPSHVFMCACVQACQPESVRICVCARALSLHLVFLSRTLNFISTHDLRTLSKKKIFKAFFRISCHKWMASFLDSTMADCQRTLGRYLTN